MNQIYIGDNSVVLDENFINCYNNSIKIIYIDPPYNTQTEKSYKDKLQSNDWEKEIKNILNKLFLLLTNDGVIFISIDDNEYASCKIICDEIFGRNNFVGTFITRQSQRSNSKLINIVHEYIICYAKNKENLNKFKIKRIDIPEQKKMIDNIRLNVKNVYISEGYDKAKEILKNLISEYCEKYDITWLKNYHEIDNNGEVFFPSDLSVPSLPREVDIPSINLHLKPLKTRGWVSDKKFIELFENNLIAFQGERPYEKKFLIDSEDNAPSILNFYSRQGTNDLNKLGLRDLFDTPKPTELIKFLIRIVNPGNDSIIFDCYAGSGTTAQAVIEVNKEDNKKLNYILIQRKECISPKSKAYKKCLELNIEPFISEVLKIRINNVYKEFNLNSDFEIIEND